MTLAQQFAAYSEWRNQLSKSLSDFRSRLADYDLCDAQTDQRFDQLAEKLRQDRLHVAFVAEFSRGKSELINALFFADQGKRMLPSTAGRTTMCPTELMYDAERPPNIALLPIETRAGSGSLAEYRLYPHEWTNIALDASSPAAMQKALRSVSDVQRVSLKQAEELGFAAEKAVAAEAGDNEVDIPRWRHAVINYPHPLLQQGLVILDTPGLNAIGTEPELTLSLLPSAHAVVFILAADTGVTQSDLAVWKEHIGSRSGRNKGQLVVLNKIDGLWDTLKSHAEIEAEIEQQVKVSAETLDVPEQSIFPVSAQKGLVARVSGDADLLARSRLPELEHALSHQLIPAKSDIVREDTQARFAEIHQRTRELLETRLAGLREQLGELAELRGKNRGVVDYMMGKVRVEKEEFDLGLQRFHAVRSVFTQLSNRLFGHLGLNPLRVLTASTRQAMLGASFSRALSEAMHAYFSGVRRNIRDSETEIGEILAMVDALQRKFVVEHGLKLSNPMTLSLARHVREIDRLEKWCDEHLNSVFQLMTHEKRQVTQRFFEEVAKHVRRIFEQANGEAELWVRTLVAPMETQIRERQIQLKRRLESIKRIHQATETLEERIKELMHVECMLLDELAAVDSSAKTVRHALAARIGAADWRAAA